MSDRSAEHMQSRAAKDYHVHVVSIMEKMRYVWENERSDFTPFHFRARCSMIFFLLLGSVKMLSRGEVSSSPFYVKRNVAKL